MKNLKKSYKIGLISCLVFSLLLSNITVAKPVVENMSITPEKPTLKSQITVTATIIGENVTDVVLYVEECSSVLGMCFKTHTTNMSKTDDNVYTGTVTLTEDKATYIQYYINVTDDTGKNNSLMQTVNLTLDTNNAGENGKTPGNGSNNKGTPGFELILLLTALLVGIIYYKRKR